MSRPRGHARAVSRIEGLSTLHLHEILSVDTLAAGAPEMRRWRGLCPFHTFGEANIPVPGRPGLRSRSVEAIWQGLKLVDGRLDLDQLSTDPHKRPPDHERGPDFHYEESAFILGEQVIGLVAARYLIYLPTYLYMLTCVVPVDPLDTVETWLASGQDVAFYDWDTNMDIDDPQSSFSHSALLARWFEGQLGPLVQRAGEIAREYGVPAPDIPVERPTAGLAC